MPNASSRVAAAVLLPPPRGLLEPLGHPLRVEGRPRVGRVLEHLGDDLAAAARIAAALHLYERGDTVAIQDR